MGNKSSRQTPISIRLHVYHGSEFINDYVITNYSSQVHRFPGGQAINMRFIDGPKQFKLLLRFTQDISVNKDRTFKEGNTMYIHLNVPSSQTPEVSLRYELHEHYLTWSNDLTNIGLTY